jgi:hypothetical protein
MKLENTHLARQLDIIPVDVLNEPITIIGAGAIGSFVTLSLAKMGFENLTVYDFDKIEIENMNCQFYRKTDVGEFKVHALKDLVRSFTDVEITAKNEAYVSGVFPGIVVMAVDSMKVRRLIWENHKEISFHTKLIIDGRMGGESALIYGMKPLSQEDIVSYEKTLYSDENAVQERCTAKATMYTVQGITGQICKIAKDFLTNNPYCRITSWNIAKNAYQTYLSKAAA